MRNTRILRRGATALAAVVLLGLGTTPAHADPGIPTVGYGYPNWSSSVRCVQYYVNQLTGLRILEDGLFGPETERGIRRIQQLAGTDWAAAPLKVDGYFGQATGQVVLERIRFHPWTVDSYEKASLCSHYVPSYTVVLN
ncbi:peptidoglycan-binding domain-containing protein [Streptomyces vietnamensis]|uniref:peptidoglycan-binding domain-containing protein n=1 Tax=Streptomyces vietnamensis TaxID=362257 RepID=UPI0037ADCB49